MPENPFDYTSRYEPLPAVDIKFEKLTRQGIEPSSPTRKEQAEGIDVPSLRSDIEDSSLGPGMCFVFCF